MEKDQEVRNKTDNRMQCSKIGGGGSQEKLIQERQQVRCGEKMYVVYKQHMKQQESGQRRNSPSGKRAASEA